MKGRAALPTRRSIALDRLAVKEMPLRTVFTLRRRYEPHGWFFEVVHLVFKVSERAQRACCNPCPV